MVTRKVKLIAEGAKGANHTGRRRTIKKRGVFLIPDFLCIAGGVTVPYFEGVQNDMNYY
jgi:glutamate dehydrogenase